MKVSFYVCIFCCLKCLHLMRFNFEFSCFERKNMKIEFNEVRSVTCSEKISNKTFFLEIPSPNCPYRGGL